MSRKTWGLTEKDKDAVWSNRSGGFYVCPGPGGWAEASANLWVLWGPLLDGFKWQSTPFQVANAGHRPKTAAKLVAEWGKGNAG